VMPRGQSLLVTGIVSDPGAGSLDSASLLHRHDRIPEHVADLNARQPGRHHDPGQSGEEVRDKGVKC